MSYHVASRNIPDAEPKVENPGIVNSDSLAAESVNEGGDFAQGSEDRGPNAGPFGSSSDEQKQDESSAGRDVFQPAAVGDDAVLDGENHSSSSASNDAALKSNDAALKSNGEQDGKADYNSDSRNDDSSATTADRAGLVGDDTGDLASTRREENDKPEQTGDVFDPAATGTTVVHDPKIDSSSASTERAGRVSDETSEPTSTHREEKDKSEDVSDPAPTGTTDVHDSTTDSSTTTAERAGLVGDDTSDLASTRREENDQPEQTGDVFDPAATGTTVVHDPSVDSSSSSRQGQKGSVTATPSRSSKGFNEITHSSTDVGDGQTSESKSSNTSSGQQSSESTGLRRSDSGAGATGVTSSVGKGDAFDRPNASWTTDIGGKQDPGRVALEQMQASNAESNEGRERDHAIDNNNQFSELSGVTQA
ncbi:Hypothetical protein R9X50_00545500 [Acrodontium crateriforme]|uniref:Uncharacterized protein n=1 Tax=Acrodontium crateriforme TaxID=150365 RepID=A0AAQ3M766_9PEZI|nr:Hypothetical protein R9X50_00545500 [Acrodontium crateriforme]